jgi:hypothetical protein
MAVVGKLVKKIGERELHTEGETIHKTIQNKTQNTQNRKTYETRTQILQGY